MLRTAAEQPETNFANCPGHNCQGRLVQAPEVSNCHTPSTADAAT